MFFAFIVTTQIQATGLDRIYVWHFGEFADLISSFLLNMLFISVLPVPSSPVNLKGLFEIARYAPADTNYPEA